MNKLSHFTMECPRKISYRDFTGIPYEMFSGLNDKCMKQYKYIIYITL